MELKIRSSALYRDAADRMFFDGDFRGALNNYILSYENSEPLQIYTSLNASICSIQISDFRMLEFFTKRALFFANQDPEYFSKKIKPLIFANLHLGNFDVVDFYLKRHNLFKLSFNNQEEHVFILGFPRCGTTSLASAFVDSGIYIESLSPEPFTFLLGLSDDRAKDFITFENSFYSEKEDISCVVDKSTHHLLSRVFLENLVDKYKNSIYIVSTRNPIDRSISAYNFSVKNSGLNDLSLALEIEDRLIESHGGVISIFESYEKFLKFLSELGGYSVKLPIIYPSVIMMKINDIFNKSTVEKLTFFDIYNKQLTGRVVSESLRNIMENCSCIVNQTEKLDSLQHKSATILCESYINKWFKKI